MQWNNTMLTPEWALILEIMQNVSLVGMSAYLLTRLPAFKRTLPNKQYRMADKLLLGLVFGIFSAAGNWMGIPIHGAIANTRIVGAIAGGLVGGPFVGIMAGTIGAVARYYMGGFTVTAAVLSNIVVGLLSGLVHQKYGAERINVKIAFLVGLLGEAILKTMILTMSKPFEDAWKLEQAIGLPTMIGNSLAVAFFIYIVRGIVNEKQRMQVNSAQQAIRLLKKTSDTFQSGLNEQSAHKVVSIIFNELKPAAAAITDTEKVLAYIGKKDEMSCPHPDGELSAVIDAPILVLGELVGTIKVYKTGNKVIMPYETQLIQGIAESLGMQLAQQRFEQQQLTLLQTEYNMLKAQINPHFFYNTLSTIQSLVRTDHRAVRIVKDLADFFRKTLKQSNEMIPLQEELDTVYIYYRIEKARFRDRVNLVTEVPEHLAHVLIPVFSLQPLVENAIRHGVSMKRGGGTVIVSVTENAGKLCIMVKDDGVGISSDRLNEIIACRQRVSPNEGCGIGLENVNQRIRKLFGSEFGLLIHSEQGKGTQVSMTLPLLQGEDGYEKKAKSCHC